MPLYEYQCAACGHRFETIQKFSDAPLDVCPKCGAEVKKLQSAPAFQFKGSGWYITDYAKKDQGGRDEEGAAPKPEAVAGDKPAADKPAADKAAGSTDTEAPAKKAPDDTKKKAESAATSSAPPTPSK